MELAKGLDVDMDVLRVAAYLHDIAVPVLGADKREQSGEADVGQSDRQYRRDFRHRKR